MTNNRHPDPVAFSPKGWLIAGSTETTIGLGATACVLTLSLGDRGDTTVHNALLYCSGLLVVAGFITIAATLVALSNVRGHEATARHVTVTAQPIASLAKQVEHNTWAIGQLTAGRTVDMHNLRKAEERMEGLVRSLTGEAIGELTKEIRAHDEAFDLRAATWDTQYNELRMVLVAIQQTGITAAAKLEPIEQRLNAMEAEVREAIATAAKQAYADGLVDGASGIAKVRQLHPNSDASTN